MSGAWSPWMDVARADGAPEGNRFQGYPALETGNLAFPDAIYSVRFQKLENGLLLEHRIEGAPLVSRLLSEGTARHACAVSVPTLCHRSVYLSKDPVQRIEWDLDDFEGGGVLLAPMVVCTEPQEIPLETERDGVHPDWHGAIGRFFKGSRLAVGSIFDFATSALFLINFHSDETLPEGAFTVTSGVERDFLFRVRYAPGLRGILTSDRPEVQSNFLTYVLSSCLGILKREFSSEEGQGNWRTHRTLRRFADMMEEQGLGHWSDDEFSPEETASRWWPLVAPAAQEMHLENDET